MPILMKWKAGKVPVFFEMDLSFKMVARGMAKILPESSRSELVFGAEGDGIRLSMLLAEDVEASCSVDPSGAQTVLLKTPGKFGLHFREMMPLVPMGHTPVLGCTRSVNPFGPLAGGPSILGIS